MTSRLADRLDHLSPRQRVLLEQRLRERQAGRPLNQILPRPAGMAEVPLSFAQQRLWFLDQLTPGSTAYSMLSAVRITGPLSLPGLQAAFTELVGRHETLRTRFAATPDGPVQVISPPTGWGLPLIDLRTLPAPLREDELQRYLAESAARPFDLTQGPLLRTEILALGPDEHVLRINIHHIVSDGWSTGVLAREVATIYKALVRGGIPVLPPLPIQYADFALWQRQWLTGPVLQEQVDSWRARLAGLPPLLELPTDRSRPAVRSGRGNRLALRLTAGLTASLRELSLRREATLFMTLLAGFGALLGRYTRQSAIPVGSPIANRNRAEIEPLIGFFVNTLVLRVDPGDDLSFSELLEQVRQSTVAAYAHQDLPFERLVELLAPERSLGHTPLFQALLVLQNAPVAAPQLTGLRLKAVAEENRTAKFDLSLALFEVAGTLEGLLEYSQDLFDSSTIARLREHLVHLLESAAAEPSRRVGELTLLGRAERRQLLTEWNDTARPYPRRSTLHQLFEERAAHAPEAMAVVSGERCLTYRELNREANRLARLLGASGVKTDEPVAVSLERSPELIVALLAILKAGGAYLFLDPGHPAERLQLLMEDAGIRLLVAEEGREDRLPASTARLLPVRACRDAGAADDRNPGRDGDSGQLAYVSYTSGSTGRPKGVCVEHRAVVRLVRNTDYIEIGPRDVFLQHSPVAFDASTLEIWGPLLNGGCLAVCPPGRLSTREMGEAIRRFQVTHLWLTAGLFHQMAEDELDSLGTVRYLLAGGDVLSPEHVRRVRAALPATRLVNGYGPTENTTFTCCHPVDRPPEGLRSVPIGRAIANTRVHVVDRCFNPVPIGVPGELLAGGDGLARGYLGQPATTAERWVPDPFASEPGSRLYRTGDAVRLRPDGNLEFLGRIDRQVKIRGYRIEPGELESALTGHPAVREAVLVVREDARGDRHLVGYLTLEQEGLEEAEPRLRAYLGRIFPDPMVPARLVVLDRLPLTANGKVDPAALPAPEGIDSGQAFVAPRTPAEETVAGIWSQVLGRDMVGAHDDFFGLGGHSLLATQVISRVHQVFGLEVPLARLFDSPTLEAFAAVVEQALQEQHGAAAPPLVPVPRGAELPLSFAQERLWFLDRLLPGSTAYSVPAAVRLIGPLRLPVLEAAFARLVHRHEALRTRFEPAPAGPVQVISPPAGWLLPLVDLRELPARLRDRERQRRMAESAARPFDLTRGPLLRTEILALGSDEHLLLLNLHHIISDGWSLGVLVREIAALYQALVRGEAPTLPPLPIQYADFALWQRSWLSGPVLEEQADYWTAKLAGIPPLLELPTDRPRPAVRSGLGGRLGVELPAGLTAGLRTLSRREGATLFMTLLAGFGTLLGRCTGQSVIPVGSPIANRNRAEIEPLIGFFANTLVLRVDLAADASFGALLAQVRQTALGAYTHQDFPFEKLVERLAPERSLGHTPLFQVLLALLNASVATLELDDLRLEPVAGDSSTAKFDLSLSLAETAGTIAGTLEYSRDLFDVSTVARLRAHLQNLLESAVAGPSRRLDELTLLSHAEQHQLLGEWNDTRTDLPLERCLHQLFEAQAEHGPEAIAVATDEVRLTYLELERRANQLAHHLRSFGVGPEVPVGLCVERSPEMVVGMLGILKAGGAYLPLDPDYPRERLTFMAGDTGIRVLLTQERLTGRLPETDAPVLCLDRDWDTVARQPWTRIQAGSDPANLAYIIYTSGSTGRPKGVMAHHRGVVNRLLWAQHAYPVTAADRILQKASLSFDFSVWECFAPLLAGARLVLARPGGHRDPAWLAEAVIRHGITLLHFVPSMLQAFLEQSGLERCSSLRFVFSGGDALGQDLERRFLASRIPARLRNQYGPTEISIDVTEWICNPEDGLRSVPIGRPLANGRTYILDRAFQPVPLGAPGELFLGGAGVVRGYRGRPELTAERFVPDPWSGEPGARLYRTGDLVRHRPDGNLEFLGRTDFQIKIRGFRIELGEVEAALTGHPAVREAAVVVRESAAGERFLVAYAALEHGAEISAAALRDSLRERLPEHMVPASFVILDRLPLTPSGKVSRKDLPAPDRAGSGALLAPPRSELERALARIWSEVLEIEQVGTEDNFFDLGGHSMRLLAVQSRLRQALGQEVPVVDLFRHPTITALARFLDPAAPEGEARPALPVIAPLSSSIGRSDIAVIGMAGRFPGAADLEALWSNLVAGVDSISRFSDEELAREGLTPEHWSRPGHVRAGGVLEGIDLFDAAFFGFSPREAEILDPQHRLLLECAWQALEDAGYAPKSTMVPVGVYAGSRTSGYAFNVLSHPDVVESIGLLSVEQALDKDYLATRISYELDLKGPSFAIQTACSTSLVAIHVACRALLQGECGMALAGGVALRLPDRAGYLYREGGVLSPDGRCRTFDAAAQGTVPGSGVGLVVLKRLEDALRDGDTIYAVVKGTAINNDGAVKVGYTAPGIEGQSQVIAAALATGGVSPDSIQYVEAHGTATPMGDPIEVAALTRAFRAGSEGTGFCALGSVKSNLGHLDTAAGVAGFIKTVLSLEHRQIPPSLHFERPNPKIDFASSPFFVNTALAPWPAGSTPRRAGVSSFGIGGTNAHAVLEEAPTTVPSGPSRPWQLLLISARTAAALDEATAKLASFLSTLPEESLADAAYTLKVGRERFEHRRMLVCRTASDAAAALAGKHPERVLGRRQAPARRPLVYLFPGQGAQHVDMAQGLYESEPVFRRELDACAERLLPRLGRDLRDLLYPAPERREGAAAELADTRWAQPALFAVEHALARLWASWGVGPTAMIGHSLGEYVAACQAGVFSLEDALELVAVRGELMSGLPAGAMLSVDLPEAELAPWLDGSLDMAAVNGPSACVAAGPHASVAALQERLAAAGIACRPLHTSHAFHSAAMEPILDLFREQVARKRLQAPSIPFLSGRTGAWITDAEATDPEYWVRGLRETVRFGDGIARILAETATDGAVLLEAGPGGTLGSLAQRQIQPGKGYEVLASMRHPKSPAADQAVLLEALGRLWLGGAEIDWRGFYREERRRRRRLPTYPFQRRRYWIDRQASAAPFATRAPEEHERETRESGDERVAGYERPDLATAFVAPASDVERRLAGIWQDLLGTAGIGAHDNFFELGGHSLLATRVMARIREAFGLELPIDSLYDTPTLAGLAARIEAGESAADGAPPLAPAPRSGPLPVSFAQQRLLFLHLLAPAEVAYNLPLGLSLSGPLDPATLAEALRRLAVRHEVLRTTFANNEERAWQIVSPVPETGALPWIDLSALPADAARAESRRIAAEDAALPFDLLQGPVWRARLVRLAPEEHILALTLHHVTADGWSYGILFRETVELYESLVEARPPRLPELPVQYADFAVWQRSWLEGEALERLLAYWKNQLSGLPTLDLPTDNPRPPVRTGRGGVRFLSVPPEPVEALRRLALREDATLFMALAAAFSVLLRRGSGRDDIVLGTDIANRTQRETEGLIGLFVNQLVLRQDLSGDPTFRELLRRVRRVTLEAYKHQDAPFDKLVQALNPPRDASRTPLFQVKLVLQNTPSEMRTVRGLSVSALGLQNRTAKFDLLLNLSESASGLACELEYSSDLWEPASADRLLDRFAAVLRTVAGQPEARLGEIDAVLAGLEAQEEEKRDRERRSVSLARARRQTVVPQPVS